MFRTSGSRGPVATLPVQKSGHSQVTRSENQGRSHKPTLRYSGNAVLKPPNTTDPPKISVTEGTKSSIRPARSDPPRSTLAQMGQLSEKKTIPEQVAKPVMTQSSLAKTPSRGWATEQKVEASTAATEKAPPAAQSSVETGLRPGPDWSSTVSSGRDSSLRNAEKSSLASAGTTSISTASSLPRSQGVYVGLRNLGNTCFMNSVLQCVAHTPQFIDALLANRDANQKSKLRGQLAAHFRELMLEMRSSKGVVSPDDVKTMVGKWAPQFSGYNQQDAHEFLRFLLDGLHEDLNRVVTKEPYRELKCGDNYSSVAAEWFEYNKSRDDSIVMNYFRGQLLTVITCSLCRRKSAACDTFLDLSVPIANSAGGCVTLEACLAKFIEETEVDDYKCEFCKKTSRSAMEMTIWKFPPILVIHLKRFSNSSWRREKIDSSVSIPALNFNLRAFAPHSSDPSVRSAVYSLFGVSHHIGSLYFGHYVADCLQDGQWVNFDDSRTAQTACPRTSSTAYVLFYARSDV